MLDCRDELNRKMDHKRQEISDFQRLCRQLEDQVHKLREEKVHTRIHMNASPNPIVRR